MARQRRHRPPGCRRRSRRDAGAAQTASKTRSTCAREGAARARVARAMYGTKRSCSIAHPAANDAAPPSSSAGGTPPLPASGCFSTTAASASALALRPDSAIDVQPVGSSSYRDGGYTPVTCRQLCGALCGSSLLARPASRTNTQGLLTAVLCQVYSPRQSRLFSASCSAAASAALREAPSASSASGAGACEQPVQWARIQAHTM